MAGSCFRARSLPIFPPGDPDGPWVQSDDRLLAVGLYVDEDPLSDVQLAWRIDCETGRLGSVDPKLVSCRNENLGI
jgi:hypothetical protein